MSHILIYTSAPKGLDAGKSGYCTVARDASLPGNLERELHSHSGYRWLGDPGDALNPVVFLHYRVKVAGKPVHLVSRVADSGMDHTGRSNKLACHLAFDPREAPSGGPGWLLHQGVLPKAWDGKLNGNLSINIPTSGEDRPGCVGWKNKTGDAGWGGVLAQAIADHQRQPIYVIYQKGFDLLALFRESLSLLPDRLRWEATFTTFFTKLPPGLECHWRGVVAGTEQETLARRSGHVIDLTGSLGTVDGKYQGEYIDAARSGRKLQVKKQAAASRPPFDVPDDDALEASLREEERKPSLAAPPDRRRSPKGAPPPRSTPTSPTPSGSPRPRRTPGGRRPATPLPESSASGRESKGILPIIIALMILFLIVVGVVTWNLAPWVSDTASKPLAKARQQAESTKEEAAREAKEEAERKADEEAERKAPEEAERKADEEAERKAEEEAERKAEEEAERKAEEDAERKAEEEAERKADEEAKLKPFSEAVLTALYHTMRNEQKLSEEELPVLSLERNSENSHTFLLKLISDGTIPKKWQDLNQAGDADGVNFDDALSEKLEVSFYPPLAKNSLKIFEPDENSSGWKFDNGDIVASFKFEFSLPTNATRNKSSDTTALADLNPKSVRPVSLDSEEIEPEKTSLNNKLPKNTLNTRSLRGTFTFVNKEIRGQDRKKLDFLASRLLRIKDKGTDISLYFRLKPSDESPSTGSEIRIPGDRFRRAIILNAKWNQIIDLPMEFKSRLVPEGDDGVESLKIKLDTRGDTIFELSHYRIR